VSLSFSDRLLIGLAPAAVSLVRVSGVLRPRIGEARIAACDPALGAQPWQGAVAALSEMKLPAGKATVVLSNHFVRYALVPWSDALSGEEEESAYVRHHFARIHGERARGWAMRAAEGPAGAPRLASAIDAQLLAAIKQLFSRGTKARLVSVQPYLMAVFNRWRGSIPSGGAWLVLIEADRACALLHDGRRWQSVHNARGSWLALIERERHRASAAVPELVLAHADRPVEDVPGWQLRRLPVPEPRYAAALAAA